VPPGDLASGDDIDAALARQGAELAPGTRLSKLSAITNVTARCLQSGRNSAAQSRLGCSPAEEPYCCVPARARVHRTDPRLIPDPDP
jgi:hypothetical protein